jgi:excisionase family DNA binding protein
MYERKCFLILGRSSHVLLFLLLFPMFYGLSSVCMESVSFRFNWKGVDSIALIRIHPNTVGCNAMFFEHPPEKEKPRMKRITNEGNSSNGAEVQGLSVMGCTRRWNISASLLRKGIREGKLKVHRVGRRVVVPIAALDAWVAGK